MILTRGLSKQITFVDSLWYLRVIYAETKATLQNPRVAFHKMRIANNNEKYLSAYAVLMAEELQKKWQQEIEEAINKAKMGITTNKRTKLDKWFWRR